MFFMNKSSVKLTDSPKSIAILGTSATALYLARAFAEVGHFVSILCPPQTADEYNTTDFLFKDTTAIKNQRSRFVFRHELTDKPDLLFIASTTTQQPSDFSLLSASALSQSIVVRLDSFDDNSILTELLHKPTINAYTFGWLNRHKNHITVYGTKPHFTFSLADKTEESAILREVFESAQLRYNFFEDDNTNLWNFMAPQISFQLLQNNSEQTIAEQAQKDQERDRINALLEEVSALALQNRVSISATNLLNKIYEFPSHWISPLQDSLNNHKPTYFNRLSRFLLNASGQNQKKYPILYGIIHNLCNKY